MNHIRFQGIGLNTHAQLLPLKPIDAIGIKWVRADEGSNATSLVAQVIKHYGTRPVLWLLGQTAQDWIADAKRIVAGGCHDIQVGIEPDAPWFKQLSPAEYSQFFLSIRKAVGQSVRLYGPSTSRWNPKYIQACIDLGCDFDGILSHLYWTRVEDMGAIYLECWRKWNLPFVCGEVGFVAATEGATYPDQWTPAEGFKALKSVLGWLPCAYYDGPNDNKDKTVGLFDKAPDGSWSVPSATYKAIVAPVPAPSPAPAPVAPDSA